MPVADPHFTFARRGQPRTGRNRERLKALIMNHRPTTFAVLTTGLIVAAGFGGGCQSPRVLRSFEVPKFPWKRHVDREPYSDDNDHDTKSYVPESYDEVPGLRLPPEPEVVPQRAPNLRAVPMPVPPAVENEAKEARRWLPTRSNHSTTQVPQVSRETYSESDEFNLPPARVTYDEQEFTEEPIITPAPEAISNSQPRLFRPASTAKNMFDSMKRKLGR